jgi:mannitol-1-/sugar-/sorbitol-6-/2-deoxyglucose-6-phosphatase
MNQAIIFDMDGVIIDSEPLWQAAEKTIFQTVGLHLTTEMCYQTMGLRTDQVIRYWYDRQPWTGKTIAQMEQELLIEVGGLMRREGQAMPGLYEILREISGSGWRCAIASSSPRSLIQTVVEKLALGEFFEAIYSGYDVPYGKPDPAVYLAAAQGLGIAPSNCVAIEDSFAGVQSAKAAGMKVIAIPERRAYGESRFDVADRKLQSLRDLSLGMIQELLL